MDGILRPEFPVFPNAAAPVSERTPEEVDRLREQFRKPIETYAGTQFERLQVLEERLRSGEVLQRGDLLSMADEMADTRRKLGAAFELSRREALSDPLTNLPNRRDFVGSLEREFGIARRSMEQRKAVPGEGMPAVLHIDLDHFKSINDTFGHDTGDRYLRLTATRMREVLQRSSDVIGRLGGDEFAVAVVIRDAGELELIAQKLKDAVDAASAEARSELEASLGRKLSDREGVISASIGYAIMDEKDQSPQDLLDRADYAGYIVKMSGKADTASYEYARAMDATGQVFVNFRREKRGTGTSPDASVPEEPLKQAA